MSSLHEIQRVGKRAYRRVGRGQSSKRGKTSGRGGKGQTARAGHKIRPELRDIIKKMPKRRGYGKNRARTVDGGRIRILAVSLERLDNAFENGAEITLKALREKKILGRKEVAAKVVGHETSKKFSFKGLSVSESARAAIEKAGGSIALPIARIIAPKKPKTTPTSKDK